MPRDKLVNLINHFGSKAFDRAHVSDDFFGNAYDYLIRNFASKTGKSSGEFYTPAEVGFLMLHGQESNVATYNISRINMILHGIPVWDHKQGDSLHDPRHLTSANRLKQYDRIIKLFQYDYFRAHKQMRL